MNIDIKMAENVTNRLANRVGVLTAQLELAAEQLLRAVQYAEQVQAENEALRARLQELEQGEEPEGVVED